MEDAKEEWRTIAKWPDYEVSNLGRVRRAKGELPMTVVCYVKVGLQKPGGGGRDWPSVHKLVAEAFHGERPSKGHVVNHKNGAQDDNRADNLEWVTYQENTQHAVDTGLFVARGERHANALLTEAQVAEIKTAYTGAWGQQKTLAEKYGVSRMAIGQIVRGENWRHVDVPVEITATPSDRKNARLTAEQVAAVLDEYRGPVRGELVRLAKKYDVLPRIISNIIRGKSWRALSEGRRPVLQPPRPGVRFTEAQVTEIVSRCAGKRGEQAAVAREFGVTPQRINKIVRGREYANAAAGAVA